MQKLLIRLLADIIRNAVPDAIRLGMSVVQGFRPTGLVQRVPANGMDGSPFRPQAEGLNQEGELR